MSLAGFALLGSIEAPTLTGTATGVPLLVKPNTEFTAAMKLKLDVGGGDLRFSSDAAGLNQLPCEIVDGLDVVWVKPTGVSISTGATLYVWGDNTGASQPAVGDAFGRDAVWSANSSAFHLEDATGLDSSGNLPTASVTGSPTVTTGIVGNGLDFDGSIDFIEKTTNILTGTAYSVSLWVNFDDLSSRRCPFSTRSNTNTKPISGIIDVPNAATGLRFLVRDDASNVASVTSVISAATNYHVAAVRDGNNIELFINGSSVGTNSATFGTISATRTRIGADVNSPLQGIIGLVDEVLTRNYAATSDQISIEYDNQSTTGSWWIASDVAGGISITESVVNSNYASLDPAILLTGSISVTESLVNTNYAATDPTVTLTGSISITESIVNANYTSLNPVIDLTGVVSVAEALVNSNYISLDPVINLTSGAIEIIESTAGTQYAVFNPSILLTPEPLGIVSTVCFNGELADLNYSGQSVILEFSGQLETAIFNGEFNALDFSGTIQTTCADGAIKTNC